MERLETLLLQLRTVTTISEAVDLDSLQAWACRAVGSPHVNIVARSYAYLAGVCEERGSLGLRPSLRPWVWEAVQALYGLPLECARELTRLEPCIERVDQLAQALAPPTTFLLYSITPQQQHASPPLRQQQHANPLPPHSVTQAALALLQLRCHNRGRERRKLRHFLTDWAPLQELADTLDMQLQQASMQL